MLPVISSLYILQSKRIEELKSSATRSVSPAVLPAHIFAMLLSLKNTIGLPPKKRQSKASGGTRSRRCCVFYFSLPMSDIACTWIGRPNRLIKPSASFWL